MAWRVRDERGDWSLTQLTLEIIMIERMMGSPICATDRDVAQNKSLPSISFMGSTYRPRRSEAINPHHVKTLPKMVARDVRDRDSLTSSPEHR